MDNLVQWFMLASQIKHSTMHCEFFWDSTLRMGEDVYCGMGQLLRAQWRSIFENCSQVRPLTKLAYVLRHLVCEALHSPKWWIRRKHLVGQNTAWIEAMPPSQSGHLTKETSCMASNCSSPDEVPDSFVLFLLQSNIHNLKFTTGDIYYTWHCATITAL